jgi:hypothetical protein
MAETDNIARMAEIVSNSLFARYFWKTTGGRNQNWPCEDKLHQPRKTHPSDVVFYYDEPYILRRTYVNCDLKSYKKTTITAGAVLSALGTLAESISCIELSDTWRKMYVHDGFTPAIAGLLFIYNHDGEYDKNFDHILNQIRDERIRIPRGTQVAILGPKQIEWLDNIRYEMVYMRGCGELPAESLCRFEYPHLVRKKKLQVQQARAATIDMLLGPWITLGYDAFGDRKPGYVVFYAGHGECAEEFLYLIDYLMHYQMVRPGTDIKIRTLDPDPNSAAYFKRAIDEYIANFKGGDEITALLQATDYRQIEKVHRTFSEIYIGMHNA